MAPLGFAWSTFAAILVTAGSVVAAIIWAVLAKSKGSRDDA